MIHKDRANPVGLPRAFDQSSKTFDGFPVDLYFAGVPVLRDIKTRIGGHQIVGIRTAESGLEGSIQGSDLGHYHSGRGLLFAATAI